VLATIMFAGTHLGSLSIVLFILGVAVFMYLYLSIIGLWLHRGGKRSLPDRRQQESLLPVPRWALALPAIGAMTAVILFVSGQTGASTLALFFVSALAFGGICVYLIRVWDGRSRSTENNKPRDAR
jgi:hypothetical protein